VIAFTDATTLIDKNIGVIFVINSQSTKADICRKSKHHLENVNANIIGVVLNKVDSSAVSNYSYNYYSKQNNKKREKKLKTTESV
jgi:Mrp family chromosome partitioning ATPase